MSNRSRYAKVSRRAFLQTSALAALSLLRPGESHAAATTKKRTTTTVAKKTTTTKASSTTKVAATTKASSTKLAALAPVGTFDAANELAVSFTYNSGGGFRVRNPYLAVWLENPDGALVQTISLWYQGGRGVRWLPELRRWYNADQDRIFFAGGQDNVDLVSSPTRQPGTYTVAWDGKAATGSPVALGEYYLCIEAAREHGPYSLIREKITLGKDGFSTKLSPNGELTEASVELRRRV